MAALSWINIGKFFLTTFDKFILLIISILAFVKLPIYSLFYIPIFAIFLVACVIISALGVFTFLQKYFYMIFIPIILGISVFCFVLQLFIQHKIDNYTATDQIYLKFIFIIFKDVYLIYAIFLFAIYGALIYLNIKTFAASGCDLLKTYLNMEQIVSNICNFIFGFGDGSFNPESIINRSLNSDFHNFLYKFYKTYYVDSNYTLGQILSYNPGATSVNNPLYNMLQQIYVKPLKQDDVADFGGIVVSWLIGYLNNTKELSFYVSNGVSNYAFGFAVNYLHSLSFTTIDDIMNISIPKIKYYMLLQMPFDFMYKSGFLPFINRRAIINHLITNSYLQVESNINIDTKVSAASILAAKSNPASQPNINVVINSAQQNLCNISIGCIKSCQLPYVSLNTNTILMNMQVYSAVLSSWLQNLTNIDPLRVLYNTCFACEDPNNATSLMTVPYSWNGNQVTIINNQNLYSFLVDTSVLDTTHFYTDAVKEMSALSVSYTNLASTSIEDALWSLLIKGYINYSNNPLVIRQDAVGNLFALFVISQNFESDVNQVAFQQQLIATLANAATNPRATVGGATYTNLQTIYNAVMQNPPGVLTPTADSSPLQSQISNATNAILNNITSNNLGQTVVVNADNGTVGGPATGNIIQLLVNDQLLQIIQIAKSTPSNGNTLAALSTIQNFVSQQLNQSKIVAAQSQVITDFVKNAIAYPIAVLSRLRVTGAITISSGKIANLSSVPYREFAFAYLFGNGATPSKSVIQGTFSSLLNALTQPLARSVLVQSIQQTFCYGRAMQYLVQSYSNFNIASFQQIYGRYYTVPNVSTGEVYVNLSAMIEDYSTNQYCFPCINVGSNVNAPGAQQYFQDQCDYYIVSMLADTVWYLSYLSTAQGPLQNYNYRAGTSSDFTGAAATNALSSFVTSQNWMTQFRNHLQTQLGNLINNGQFIINLGGTNITLRYPGIGGLGVNLATISNKIAQIVKEYTPDYMNMECYLKSFSALANQNSVNSTANAVWSSIQSPMSLNTLLQANMNIDYPTMGNLIVEVPRVATNYDPSFDLKGPFYIYSAPLLPNTNQSNLYLASYNMCQNFYQNITISNLVGVSATNNNNQYWTQIDAYLGNPTPISVGNSFMAIQVNAAGGGMGINGGPLVFWACTHNTGSYCNLSAKTDNSWANNSTCLLPSASTVPGAQTNMWQSILSSINTVRNQVPYNNSGNYVYTDNMNCGEGDFPTPSYGSSYANTLQYYGSGNAYSNGLFGYTPPSGYAHSNLLNNGHNITHYIANLLSQITPPGNSYLKNPIYKIQSSITSWAPSGTAGNSLWNAAYYINAGYNINLLQQYFNDIQTYDTGGAISASSSTCYQGGASLTLQLGYDGPANIGWTQVSISPALQNPVENANGIVVNNFYCLNQGISTVQSSVNGGNITPIFATLNNIQLGQSGNSVGNNYPWQFMDFNLAHDAIVPVLQSSAANTLSYFYSNPLFFFDKDKKRIIYFTPGVTTSSSSLQNFSASNDISTIPPAP